ncbi:BTAD domain-containing putative transcriptional regulator [Streptomyces griseocarneus]|uniref:BTAD domain-containing putative transcriptional regulator n=1 Tax=Streptomyces griseocarneus TaxID=51201 RepID=UPI00167D8947|nr:BTAD domain-containing putative transcriptional regulator [Streptomyces griseocarneus]MBZ6473668.1 winged helix-turn-helix domain-containing protein [Streptomyces griseocarneus]GHG64431.1 SARP family transcriptional regulator [Streptomyces griseocarneus]
MRFGVLGPLTVWDEVGDPVTVREAKVRALLALLLAHEGRPVSADRLLDHLWGEALPADPANALQVKVSQLRRTVGRDRVPRRPPGYHLQVAAEETDAGRFRALVSRAGAATGPRERARLLTEALGLWRGPAFADFADQEYVRPAALRLEELRLAALEDRARARLELGEHDGLAAELSDLVARHPLRERLRALQLRALYAAGRQSEALASYDELRTLLAEELGLDPGPELVALHRAILAQAPELSPAPQAPPPRTNLPAALGELVGRQRTVACTVALLASGSRLVTLTGPGGVGKTVLATEIAARLRDGEGEDGTDGVWLVELAGQRGDRDGLAEVVAGTLGIRDDGAPPGRPAPLATDRLAAALRDRRTLLILDNCEQAVEAVADLADRLLRAAPGLRLLATSQEPLGVAAEVVRPVEPLAGDDAVRLFAARAAAADPGFALDASTRDAVEVICRRLDGLPLALELAATRVRALGVRQLADRLDDRFRVLSGSRRGAPARQRTLRAVIDWSWELLTAPERIVLRRLAVHTDGCTLRAAEAVCAGAGVPPGDVLDLLARLVDRSLVVMSDGPLGPRYRLLESVAAYATERLHEMADEAAVRERHLRYYTALAERARPALRGPGQHEWLRRLDADGGNLRTALETAVRGGRPEEALRLVAALSWYWLLRGRLGEARRWAEAALSTSDTGSAGRTPRADAGDPRDGDLEDLRAEVRALHQGFALLTGRPAPLAAPAGPEPADPGVRARTRWFRAYALFHTGSTTAAEELTGRALAGFEEIDDRWGVAAALGLRATHALIRGELPAVRSDGERSTALFRELGDGWGTLQSVGPLATLAEISGDYAHAERLLRDALELAEGLHLATEISRLLSRLGRIALLTGDRDRSRELHERARSGAVEQGFRFGEIHAELGLALTARRSGDLATAEALLLRIRDWYAEVSSEPGNSLVLAELGFVAELRGDAEAAGARHRQALAIAAVGGDPREMALPLEGLAGAESLAGRPERAALLLGAAAAARAAVGAPLAAGERGDVDRVTEAARAALGERGFDTAFGRGAGLGPREAAEAAEALEAGLPAGRTTAGG